MSRKWDVIVVGAGHAGIEAANISAKLGVSVLVLTLSLDTIGKLSCNPAVGGVSKGQLVKEIDVLGGVIGKIADKCAVNYRRLNKSKGKAVWSTRAQVDRFLYPKIARFFLENNRNIKLLEAKVDKIIVKNKKAIGVRTNFGEEFYSSTVIICAGTFLKSKIHIGLDSFCGGRLYELSSDELFEDIKRLGFKTLHFKTGTCARLDKRTIDFSKMIEQKPHYDVEPFSFSNSGVPSSQMNCYLTYTNKKTHKIILKNLDRSPLYTGKIKSKGVRYCPSLEDKVVKFPEKEKHQIFIEPEGWDSVEVYPNGISTSLPFDVQLDFIHTIEGLENAKVLRPGYGIEHGLIMPTQLYPTLESKLISGLFFAGQVNGTTGYEEAAAQGLIAGINAALKVKRKDPFILRREEAFVGVLIDDLTKKGVDEPYRMFTSRAEFRLLLRESNADIRLSDKAYDLGLIGKEEYEKIKEKQRRIEKEIENLKKIKIVFNGKKESLFKILKRPQIKFEDILPYIKKDIGNSLIKREVEINVKYEGFIKREASYARQLKEMGKVKISPSLDYSSIPSLSKEIREKLSELRPKTLGDALRISGITPAAIVNIYNYLKAKKYL
ncbi:MAG: tRNA uridine-5-carboxymethylaminomethyl(34) synthesis enzyme MnmG [Candidatus Omnitrophica bacterium 4484_70.1]|nr:MAG: tRNA uridine-5-carboxymethylaminomethyl(34) synthesis enzyme MnmG [Candidatus Omnitrophica bacterium 4484_70.1]